MLPSQSRSQVLPEIAAVYDRFMALTAASADLGGSLLLYAGLDANGVAVAIASNTAGAASLGLEPDTGRAKAALRAGVCDFVVNHLDEALRILKNEIRRKQAVSVVLEVDPHVTVEEIVARGVQPEIVAFPMSELQTRGARLLEAAEIRQPVPVAWGVQREGPQWLPVLDKLAVASLSELDARVRWIESAPRYLGRGFAGRRYVRMTEAEANAFVATVRAAVQSGAVPVSVTVERGGEAIRVD